MYDSVIQQCKMALDQVRNKAYFRALEKIITPESVVLDVGAGLGVLGLMAAQLGARKVYLVEPEPVLKVAKKIAEDNGLVSRVEFIQDKIQNVELAEKVDVIISVFTSNFLLGENLLPALYFARDNFLKPGGVLLPDSGDMWLTPVCAPKLYHQQVGIAAEHQMGLKVDAVKKHLVNQPLKVRHINKDHYLSAPKLLKRADFNEESVIDCHESLEFEVSGSRACHGFVGWLEIDLLGETVSSAPHAEPVHWSPLFFSCDQPISLSENEKLKITVHKTPKPFWNWQFDAGGKIQRLSGLHARLPNVTP